MNREFQPAKGRAYLAMLMLGIMVAVMVVRIVFAVADPADASGVGLFVILAFYAGLFAAGVAFVVWNYRASRNLAAIGAPGQVATPVWTVAFWLAPVFFSYFAMREMWKGSRPEIDSENLEGWTEGPGSRLVNFWWGAWIVTFYVGFVVRLVFIGRGWNVDRVVLSGWTSAAFDCIFVACLVLGIVLVWRIRSNQGRRYLLYRELIEAGTIVENRESGKEISGDLVASAL